MNIPWYLGVWTRDLRPAAKTAIAYFIALEISARVDKGDELVAIWTNMIRASSVSLFVPNAGDAESSTAETATTT